MLLTRLKSFSQARIISLAVGSHWLPLTRYSHNEGRFKHCCIERNRLLTRGSINLNTARCLSNETITSRDAGGNLLRHSAKITRNTLVLPDKEADEFPGKRKLRTALAEYSLDDDGYMDVRDVVSFLKQENALDICVIKATGNKRSYVEFLVVVSGVSTRHLRAMATNLEEMFKGHNVREIGKGGHVSVEGLESDYWMAVDIGNMVVHFFLPEVREVYELEKLWTLGPQYDDQFRSMFQEEEYLNATHMGTTWNAPDNLHIKSLPEAGIHDK